jgi:hypothetical protein
MNYTNRRAGIGCLLFGAISFAFAATCSAVAAFAGGDFAGYLGGTFFCSSLGAMLLFLAVACFGWRIDVDAMGLTRSALFGLIVYRDAWSSLRKWYIDKVRERESASQYSRAVFDFSGRWWPFAIDDAMDEPGFSRFVEEVRAYAGPKERLIIGGSGRIGGTNDRNDR